MWQMFNKGSIYFENLYTHIKSKKHRKTATTKQDKSQLAEAKTYLQGLNDQNKVDESEKEDEDIEEEHEHVESQTPKPKAILKESNQTHFKLQIAGFLIENNLPFSLGEKIAKFLKSLYQLHNPEISWPFNINSSDLSIIVAESIGRV